LTPGIYSQNKTSLKQSLHSLFVYMYPYNPVSVTHTNTALIGALPSYLQTVLAFTCWLQWCGGVKVSVSDLWQTRHPATADNHRVYDYHLPTDWVLTLASSDFVIIVNKIYNYTTLDMARMSL